MKKNRVDEYMPVGKLSRIRDILPPPEELVVSEKTVKVTLRLSERSVGVFKQYANKYHTKYQKMIRRLIDAYADRFAMPH
jgi:hypothetical protein